MLFHACSCLCHNLVLYFLAWGAKTARGLKQPSNMTSTESINFSPKSCNPELRHPIRSPYNTATIAANVPYHLNNVQCANIQFIIEASVASQIYVYTKAVTLIAEKYIHVRSVLLKYRYNYSWAESPSIPQHWIVQGFNNCLVCQYAMGVVCYAFNCALPNQMKICFILSNISAKRYTKI